MTDILARGPLGRFIHSAAIATLPMLLAACTEPDSEESSTPMPPAAWSEPEDYSMPDEQTLVGDSRYMGQVYEQRVQESDTPEIRLDLSDDGQYRFVLHRLLAAGNTPDDAPELFARLRDARRQAMQGSVIPPGPKGTEPIGEADQALGTATPCKHFIHIDEFTNSVETRFRPVAISSCYSGVQHTYTDLMAFRSNLDETAYEVLGSAPPGQGFGSPYNFKVAFNEPDPGKPGLSIGAQADPDALFVVDSVSAVTDSSDMQAFTFVTIKTVGAAVPWPLTLKYEQVNDVFGPTPAGVPAAPCKAQGKCTLQMNHPKNLVTANLNTYTTPYDSDGRIRVCVDRGYASQMSNINRDCDYLTYRKEANNTLTIFPYPYSSTTGIAGVDPAVAEVVADPSALWPAPEKYYPSSQYMPYKGTYNLYHPDPSCSIQAYEPARTQASLLLVEAGGFCNAGVAGDVQNVDLEKAFPVPGMSDKASLFNLLARYGACQQALTAKTIEAYVAVYTTAKGTYKCGSRFASVKVTPVDFKKSCFAEGTLIHRADGLLVPVEHFEPGDRVLSTSAGTTLTITAVARGAEHEPLVNLFDEDGHDLLLTKTHPVVTPNRGVVQADALQPGDTVVTEHGIKTLVHVSRVEYDREVFNFALGTAEELAAVGNEGRTMFADGYLVGDNEMQFELERTAAAPSAARTLPPAWRVDYERARARGMVVHAPPGE